MHDGCWVRLGSMQLEEGVGDHTIIIYTKASSAHFPSTAQNVMCPPCSAACIAIFSIVNESVAMELNT